MISMIEDVERDAHALYSVGSDLWERLAQPNTASCKKLLKEI